MRINFIIPFTGLTGGIKIALEYANRLSERGHDVLIYAPIIAYKFNDYGFSGELKRIKATLGNIKRGNKIKWFNLKVYIKLVPVISNAFIRDADVTIATAWPTAYSLNDLNGNKGRKVYLIQHYEIWSGPKQLVDNSYKLPLKHIVIAKWLKDLMLTEFNVNDSETIYNGIDFNEFNNENKKINKEKTVTMLYHKLEWKGFKDGLEAFELVKKKIPNLNLILFGLDKVADIPNYAKYYLSPSKVELNNIYSSSDVFIFPSRKEGWGLTPIEAMACKCAVVGTDTGAMHEVGINDKNALISKPENIYELASNLEKILSDDILLENISFEGYKTALQFSWEKSIDKFEKVISKTNEDLI